jgi:hypothetical protein
MSSAPPANGAPPLIYFERQQRMMCLKHTLNNLLQRAAFSSSDLDAIARRITAAEGGGVMRSLVHRWPVLGNYDDDVLRGAAGACGIELIWVMAERPGELPPILTSADPSLEQSHVIGIIVNTRSKGLLSSLTGKRLQHSTPPCPHNPPPLPP